MKLKTVVLTQHEVNALLHWASVGIRGAVSGSYLDGPDIVEAVAKRAKYYTKKPIFGEYREPAHAPR